MDRFPLGFSFERYAAIWEVKFGSGAGKLDLTVVTDEPSILLIEAKLHKNPDAKDKVLGQLVFYLAHALECSPDAMVHAVKRAATHKANKKPRYWNGEPRRPTEPGCDEVEEWIRGATRHSHRETHIRGLIALDSWSQTHDDKRLLVPLAMLLKHGLPVSLVLASGEFISPKILCVAV
jgi:hypothetical protein